MTRWGIIRVPPFATVHATRAIWSGVTRVSAWPYDAFASSTSSVNPPGPLPPGFVTCAEAVGRSNGSGLPKPIRPAKEARLSPPVRRPVRAYQMFDDHSVASMKSKVRDGTPGCSWIRKPPTTRPFVSAFACWGNVVVDWIRPDPNPAMAVTILKTEPGTYWPWVALVRRGWALSSRTAAKPWS